MDGFHEYLCSADRLIEVLERAAADHQRNTGEIEMEAGDLQVALRAAIRLMTPVQREEYRDLMRKAFEDIPEYEGL